MSAFYSHRLGIDGRHSILYEIDQTGRVIQTLHDAHGKLINGLSHACDLSDGQIAGVIDIGPGAMPSYRSRLDEEQIASLIVYLRAVQAGEG